VLSVRGGLKARERERNVEEKADIHSLILYLKPVTTLIYDKYKHFRTKET